MHHFTYRGDALHAESVPLAVLAERLGTPLYVYSLATLRRHYRVFDSAFAAVPHLVCFSVKANGNLAILRALAREGSGFDVVSRGELFRVLRAGGDPRKVVFSGVGKTAAEIEDALVKGILLLNVESAQELGCVNAAAGVVGKRAPIGLRINPGVDPRTHPYVATGAHESKFGIHLDDALDHYRAARSLRHVEVLGVDCHIGSQLTSLEPFVEALARVRELVLALKDEGFDIRYLDMGGGLGITYSDEAPPSPAEYARALTEGLGGLAVTLVLEPGRVIAGNAGVLLTRVLYCKETGGKRFVVVDAGMNDLVRPALYGSFQAVELVRRRGRRPIVADVVGPVCESGDFLARDRRLEEPDPGDLLAVMSAGAYGFTMASTYNARPRSAEVLVDGKNFHVVREREGLEDLVRGEHIPDFLA